MEYTVRLDQENKIIIATPRGDWDLETDNAMIHQIMSLVDATDAQKVLLDIRELRLNLSIVDIFEHAKEVREKRRKFGKVSAKVALVYSSADKRLEEDMLFFETAARNRGMPYQVFKNMGKAMKWLLKP